MKIIFAKINILNKTQITKPKHRLHITYYKIIQKEIDYKSKTKIDTKRKYVREVKHKLHITYQKIF